MKRAICMLLGAAIILSTAWASFLLGVRVKKVRLSEFLPAGNLDVLHKELPWIKQARVYKTGQFVVVVPSSGEKAEGIIFPVDTPYYPQIWFDDTGQSDDRMRSVSIVDSEQREINLVDANQNGRFDSFSLIFGADTNRMVLSDRNFDGTFDIRMKASGQKYVSIDEDWYRFHMTNGQMLVDGETGPRTVLSRDGRFFFHE